MEFTAKDVAALREKTGCGMMDCKKALVETNGDMDKAVDFLREKGLAAAAKKSGRIAAEGIVTAVTEAGASAVIEVNSETDFVAKNEEFQKFANDLAMTVAKNNPADIAALSEMIIDGGDMTAAEALQEKVLKIGENIQIRRFARFEGITSTYIHMGGRIGVMVSFDATNGIEAKDEFKAAAKDIAMQVAAANPQFLDTASVPAETLEHEKKILREQVLNEGKPEAIADKIVAGKIAKYYKENCLIDQVFIKDNDITVAKYLEKTGKELGGEIVVKDFVRFEKGEGLQKREDNFADEVANMVK